MSKLFSAKIKYKSFSSFLVVVLVVSMLAAGAFTGNTGSIKAVTDAAEISASATGESGYINLTEDYNWEDQVVATLPAQGTYTARFVYNDEEEPEEEEEEPDPEEEEEPVDEEEDEPEEEEEDEPETIRSTVTVSTDQGEKATGEVDVPDGATVEIGDQPANGSAQVDQDGNWEYTPESGFSGEDQFTILIEHADGTEEIITVEVTVAEAEPEEDEEVDDPVDEDEEEDEEALPASGGVIIASVLALWLFVAAVYSLRVGIIKK